MSEKIETLLRNAGHGPTRELDIARVHAAGRRRARARTLATGVSMLALLGVAAVGVNVLLPDSPDAPFIDQAPTEPAPMPDDGRPDGEPAEVAAPALATTVARLTRNLDAEVEVTLTAPDGTTTAFSIGSQVYGDLAGSVAVDGEGRAVLASAVGDLVRSGPDGSMILATGDAQAGTPWRVHGVTDRGDVLVSRIDLAGDDELLVVRGDEIVPWPLQRVTAPTSEEQFGSATAVGDRLLVTIGVGDSVRWLLFDGAAAPVEVLSSSTMPFDDVPHFPALIGDELWHLETRASENPEGGGPQDLVLRVDDQRLRLPTPYGRDIDAFVGAVTIGQFADGTPALLLSSIAHDRSGGPGPALLVDLDTARSSATASGADRIPDGVFVEVAASEHVQFVP